MKKVLTVGVFDYFHLGHLRLFKNAKKLGDYLIVAVQDGDFILKFKPDAKVLYTTEQRLELVSALKVVDEVVTYEAVDEDIKKFDFDVFAIGGDQNHEGFQRAVKWCEEKARKDKLWKIEATVFEPYTKSLHLDLTAEEIPCNYIPKIGKWSVFNIYCDTQEKSKKVKVLLDKYEAKYFVSETKTL